MSVSLHGAGININMYIENFHWQLKHITMDGIFIKCVDELIAIRQEDSVWQTTTRVHDIRTRHDDSVHLDVSVVQLKDKTIWIVPPTSSGEVYLVKFISLNSCCQLK